MKGLRARTAGVPARSAARSRSVRGFVTLVAFCSTSVERALSAANLGLKAVQRRVDARPLSVLCVAHEKRLLGRGGDALRHFPAER